MKNIIDLSNQKILVTGASSGIGRATAILLSQVGANLVLVGRNEEELSKTQSLLDVGQHMYCCCDLTQLDTIEPMIKDAVEYNGEKLTGLVHSAGISALLPLKNLSYEKMDNIMRVHYYAWIELIKYFSLKKHSNGGSIVAVSSIAAINAAKCQTIYAAAKASINISVRTLAMELIQKRIRINAVMPGMIHTNMVADWVTNTTPEFVAGKAKNQLLDIGEPTDVANLIAFLLSDAARFMTGHSYWVDGGILLL